MVTVSQGEIWWADLPEPTGSGPGYRRPIIIIQSDRFNNSRIGTTVGVLFTGNLNRADSPGNILLPAHLTGLPQDSVVNVSQIVTIDTRLLLERVGKLSLMKLELVFAGIDIVLGR